MGYQELPEICAEKVTHCREENRHISRMRHLEKRDGGGDLILTSIDRIVAVQIATF